MRKANLIITLFLSLVLMLGVPLASQHSQAQAGVSISFSFFHNSLSPYGNWVNVGNYGTCWRPSGLAVGFQPYYTNGHWVYTEYGWTWVSNDPWGDIAYHYGSWYDDASYGWVWVPGYTWSPAW